MAVLTLDTNFCVKLPFLDLRKSSFCKCRIVLIKSFSSKWCGSNTNTNHENHLGYFNLKNVLWLEFNSPFCFLKGNSREEAIEVTLSLDANWKVKKERWFCFAALFKSCLLFERNRHTEMGKGKTRHCQSEFDKECINSLCLWTPWWKRRISAPVLEECHCLLLQTCIISPGH